MADHPVASELPFATPTAPGSMVPFASKPPTASPWEDDHEGVPTGLPRLVERSEPRTAPTQAPSADLPEAPADEAEQPAHEIDAVEGATPPVDLPSSEDVWALGSEDSEEWQAEDSEDWTASEVPEAEAPVGRPAALPPTDPRLSGELHALRAEVDRLRMFVLGAAVVGAILGAAATSLWFG